MKLWIWLSIATVAVPGWAQDGARLFRTYCAACHEGGERAPSRDVLTKLSPEQIITALEKGAMTTQGAERSRAERRTLAEYLSGKPLGEMVNPIPKSAFCQSPDAFSRETAGPSWNGWGVTPQNTRFQPAAAARLAPGDVPRLKLKWAFGFPGATSASAQPAVFAGRVYAGSWEGDLYSLDAKTGCIRWMMETEAGVRSAVTIGKAATGGGYTAYFGDLAANVYAVNAETGKLLWKVKVDDYPLARVTGSPSLYQGRLYIPLSAREESQVADPAFVCCKFRGNVVALDASTGKRIWKTYAIEQEPQPTQKSRAGTQLWGPAGGGIWNSPAVDPKQNAVYVGTGNSYSFPPVKTTDAIVAMDMNTGKIRWVRQMTGMDVWNGGCRGGDPAVCSEDAPDYDFGASPILVERRDGKRILLAGNKSAMVYALDPDREGQIVWQQKVGRGGTSGGILWGPATDGQAIYAATTDVVRAANGRDIDPNSGGALTALDLSGGDQLWSTPHPSCADRKPCSPTQPAAISASPGVVFSGSNDGRLRAYSTKDGKILWEYDTVREFTTVNGVKAKGGSINNSGPAIAGGMVFTNAGYSHHSGIIPGNVLLAFSIE
jgi:polyvinyl alcohol dehydrogenase (cytochrome)